MKQSNKRSNIEGQISKEEQIKDEIMNLKLVELIFEQAIKVIPSKNHPSLYYHLNHFFISFLIVFLFIFLQNAKEIKKFNIIGEGE